MTMLHGQAPANREVEMALNKDPRVIEWNEFEDALLGEVVRFTYTEKRVEAIYKVAARELGIQELA